MRSRFETNSFTHSLVLSVILEDILPAQSCLIVSVRTLSRFCYPETAINGKSELDGLQVRPKYQLQVVWSQKVCINEERVVDFKISF